MTTNRSTRKSRAAPRGRGGKKRNSGLIFISIIACIAILTAVFYFVYLAENKKGGMPIFEGGRNGDNSLIDGDESIYGKPRDNSRKKMIENKGAVNKKSDLPVSDKPKFKTPDYGRDDKEYLEKLIKSK